MAMNKKELAEMERLRADLALARALRWPSYPKPKPVTREWIEANLIDGDPKYGSGRPSRIAQGWFYSAYLGGYRGPDVSHGCSDGLYHSPSDPRKTTTQNMGRMYATKAEALMALRHDVTETVANILARIDRDLEEAS